MDESRVPTDWIKFLSLDGYSHAGRLGDPKTGQQYGEIYSELLCYQYLLEGPRNWLEVYKRKLNVNF